MTTYYVDLEGVNDANAGTSFALRKKTITSAQTAAGAGVHDFRIMASPDPVATGVNATFTNGSDAITLASAVTANIDTCDSAWTASANVTATASTTTLREGTASASLAIASGFTTGLVAYKALGGATDFSGYQQISFLLRMTSGKASGVFELRLCSDAAGVTAVNTITVPSTTSGYWQAVTIDTAGALGASIQSVALYAISDPASVTVFLDNIIACKAAASADCLTHKHLIGKNSGTDPFMAIDSINGTTVKLGGGYNAITTKTTNYHADYWGTTATVALYTRVCIETTAVVSVSNATNIGDATISGGWDRTAMSSQSGLSYIRAKDMGAVSVVIGSGTEIIYDKIHTVNGLKGFATTAYAQLGEVGAIACEVGFSNYRTAAWYGLSSSARDIVHCFRGISKVGVGGGNTTGDRLRLRHAWGTSNTVLYLGCLYEPSATFPGTYPVHISGGTFRNWYSAIANDNGSSDATDWSEVTFSDCDFDNMTTVIAQGAPKYVFNRCDANAVPVSCTNGQMVSQLSIAGDATNHKIERGNSLGSGIATSDTSVRHTAADYSWKLAVGAVSFARPFTFSVAKIACPANELRTVNLWFRRDNVLAIGSLFVIGGVVAGIAEDLYSTYTSASVNTWEQITLTFTPTVDSVVEVLAAAWTGAGGAFVWIDDLEVT